MTLRILATLLGPLLGVGFSPLLAVGPLGDASEQSADEAEVGPTGVQAETAPATARPGAGDDEENQSDQGVGADAGDGADELDQLDQGDDGAPLTAQVVDVILPCGLRVITAKDASLPVAAVVLAVEVGTRDDPAKLPGLVHALAYQLQQGNRELAPGEGIATAHDVGGLAAMAVGAAQVRFESLVPISQLSAQLRVEALRLRAPTIGRELWLKSLSYARSDDGVKLLVPREAAAAAWKDEGMAHDGRVVVQSLADMLDQAVGAQLSRLYDYRAATLVVVGPDDPQALLERVEPLFAGLAPLPRKAIAAGSTPAAEGAAPRAVAIPRQRGDTMVWAVPGNPASRAWAQVLCGTLNRQARAQGEPAKARLRCTYTDDPRRPMLILRAIAFDPALGPEPLIAGRLARIEAIGSSPEQEPELAALIEAQRARIETNIGFNLRAPLELASYLASASAAPGPAVGGSSLRARDEILGLPLLPEGGAEEAEVGAHEDADTDADADPDAEVGDVASEPTGEAPADDLAPTAAAVTLAAVIPELLDTRRAVLLLDPKQDAPPPFHQDSPTPAPAAGPEPDPAIEATAEAAKMEAGE